MATGRAGKIMKLNLKFAGVAYLICTGASVAQENSGTNAAVTGSPENITVYGVRLTQPESELASSVSVITAGEIEALGVDFLIDAIATAPGVTVNQNGTYGGVASVRIRGASSEQTLVIIDGVVANDPTSPGGGYDFARLDPSSVERIEILKGPQSTLWGTDAIGGVINIITKRPAAGFGGRVFAEGGSFDTLRAGAELSGGGDRFDYRLAATRHDTDGISKADENNGNDENDGYESTTLNARAGFNLLTDARLQASLTWTNASSEFDSFVFGAEGDVGDGDESSENSELLADVSLRLPLLDGRFENLFLLGYADIERESFTGGAFSFGSEGERRQYRYQGTLAINERNRLAFGAEREETESNDDETSIDGLFALYELQPLTGLSLTAGLRRDDHERFGAETTGRLAAAYRLSEQLSFSASWGEGFKAPTLFQTTFFCCGATTPNPDLAPETSDAFDVGFTFNTRDGRAELGVTYFDQDTRNLITFDFAIGAYENIAIAKSRGFELQGSYQLTDWAGVALNYAYVDATDGNGAELIRVPRHSGDLTLTLRPGRSWSGTLLLRYNGDEQDPGGVVDGWVRVDVAGRYRLSPALELYARVENLFDEHYQQVLGYGTPGVSGYLGASLSF
jgi:vitamin B12 transporter